MAHSHDGSQGDVQPASFAHPMSVRNLLAVFVALVVLTIVTVVASNFPFGRFEVWVSLIIATVKGSLVVCFFMHMIHDKPFNVLVFLSSLFFLALFVGITLMDSNQYQGEINESPYADRPVRAVGVD